MNARVPSYTHAARFVMAAFAAALMAGCAQSLVIQPEAEVPAPLATRLPFHVAVHYPEPFREYVYVENTEDRVNWSIDCGPSQVVLFDRVLPSLFAEVSHVDAIPYTGDRTVDAIFVPKVEEMQFALPHETRTELYEAWIRYTITLYGPDGDKITEFPLTGYGKSTTSLFKGREDGLDNAINEAFRDVGARLTLGFRHHPAVRPWISAKAAERGQGAGS